MMPGNTQTDLLVDFKATVWRKQDDTGGFHRVVGWQDYTTMVDASAKCCVDRATNCEVPFKQVVLKRLSEVLFCRLPQFLCFSHQSLYSRTSKIVLSIHFLSELRNSRVVCASPQLKR